LDKPTHNLFLRQHANKALPIKNLVISFLFCLVPFMVFGEWKFLLILPLCYLGKVYLGWYFKKYIGGYTGDCLGTVQQVTEVLFYLGLSNYKKCSEFLQ